MACIVSVGNQLESKLKILETQRIKNMPILKLSYTGRQWLMAARINPAHQLVLTPSDTMLRYEYSTPQAQRLRQVIIQE